MGTHHSSSISTASAERTRVSSLKRAALLSPACSNALAEHTLHATWLGLGLGLGLGVELRLGSKVRVRIRGRARARVRAMARVAGHLVGAALEHLL